VLLRLFGPAVLNALSRTWKVEVLERERFDAALREPGRLVTLWHGRMILPLPTFRGVGAHVLVSPSADGDLVPPLLRRFGYHAIRGSSNKNPARALREMLHELLRGGTIVITPDGPRGPRHRVNPGPAWMARATGYPIVPAGCACDRAWRLSSWDRFTIPKPGARIVVAFAEPLRVSPTVEDEALAGAAEEMGRRMMEAERTAFRELGVEPDW